MKRTSQAVSTAARRARQPTHGKQPFDIDLAVRRIREAVRPFPKAALFELAEEGFDSVFEQLVACMISVRTRDETTLAVARKLFARARTPAEMSGRTLGNRCPDRCLHLP
jgi:endonuclease III